VSGRAFMQRCEEVIHVQKLGRMAHRRMLTGRGIIGEITIRQPHGEIPIELGPSCVPVHVDRNVANTELWLGEHRRAFALCIQKPPSENVKQDISFSLRGLVVGEAAFRRARKRLGVEFPPSSNSTNPVDENSPT
jgi:hypothetical protein